MNAKMMLALLIIAGGSISSFVGCEGLTRSQIEANLATNGVMGYKNTLSDDFVTAISDAHYLATSYSANGSGNEDSDAVAAYTALSPVGQDTVQVLNSLGSPWRGDNVPSVALTSREFLSAYQYFRGGVLNDSLLASLYGSLGISEKTMDRFHSPDLWSNDTVSSAGAFASVCGGRDTHRFWATGTGVRDRALFRKGDEGYRNTFAGSML